MNSNPHLGFLARFDQFILQHRCYLVRASSLREACAFMCEHTGLPALPGMPAVNPASAALLGVPDIQEVPVSDDREFSQLFLPPFGVWGDKEKLDSRYQPDFAIRNLAIVEGMPRRGRPSEPGVITLVYDGGKSLGDEAHDSMLDYRFPAVGSRWR